MTSRDLPWSAGMAGSVTTHRRGSLHPSLVTEGCIPHFKDAKVGREGKADWNCLSCLCTNTGPEWNSMSQAERGGCEEAGSLIQFLLFPLSW